jgi:hypothetical protein
MHSMSSEKNHRTGGNADLHDLLGFWDQGGLIRVPQEWQSMDLIQR